MDIKETILIPAPKSVSYDVIIGPGISASLGRKIKDGLRPSRVTVVSNPEIWELVGDQIAASLESADIYFDLIAIPEGESHKTLDTAGLVYEAMSDAKAARVDPVIAVGGGVVGDLAGFVAATFMRGVPFVNVPTTFLAMIDSSVGGKTGVDLAVGKNMVGAFHQPFCVISDVDFLRTLPARELKCGAAEAIKTAFLAGGYFMSYIEDNMGAILALDAEVLVETVKRSVRFKGDIIAADPLDVKGTRAFLNYGHTFGHALETVGSYLDLNHGEAVGLGMVFAARLSHRLGVCGPGIVSQTIELLEAAGLPVNVTIDGAEDIIGIMERDKKNCSGSARFVLLEDVGRPVLRDVPWNDVAALLKELENA